MMSNREMIWLIRITSSISPLVYIWPMRIHESFTIIIPHLSLSYIKDPKGQGSDREISEESNKAWSECCWFDAKENGQNFRKINLIWRWFPQNGFEIDASSVALAANRIGTLYISKSEAALGPSIFHQFFKDCLLPKLSARIRISKRKKYRLCKLILRACISLIKSS